MAQPEQMELATRLRKMLVERVFVDVERSLDMLQCMLVMMAWSVYTMYGRAHLLVMSNLARSLVSDLKLDKPRSIAVYPSSGTIVEEQRGSKTNEERGTLLACFALSASVFPAYKWDHMRWSAQVNEACYRLAQEAETESDKILVYIARIARLSMNAAKISQQAAGEPEYGRYTIINISSLKGALEQIKATLTSELSEHKTVMAYLRSAEVTIYELAFFHDPTSSSPLTSTTIDNTSLPSSDVHAQRTASLTTLILVCESYLELFLASNIVYATAPAMLLFCDCHKIAYKLNMLRLPGWNLALVKATLNPLRYTERAAKAAEAGNKVLKQRTGADSIFKTLAEHLWKSMPAWEVDPNGEPEQMMYLDKTGMNICGDGLEASELNLDLCEDNWLSEVFNL